jgi:hypothetical protein
MAKAKVVSGARSRAAGPVRITVPAKVAYNPAALKKSIAQLVERLGCPTCFSGADCLFEMERRFVLTARTNPDPIPWQPTAAAIDAQPAHMRTVGMAKGVRHDINKVFQAIDKTIDIIGPHPCISGFDIFFKDVLQTVVIPENFEAQVFDQNF